MESGFVLMSLGILIAAVGPADESRKPLTPAEITATCHGTRLTNTVVVKYRVRDVAESNPDWIFLYADELPNRNLFAVQLSRQTRAALQLRGVSDLARYFAGKEVEFEGHPQVTILWCFPACDLYKLRVESLEQFRSLRESD